jgi:predicted PurR-regulated permease PerM
MKRFGQYSTWLLAFLFAAGLIIIYKTVDNLSNVFAFFGNALHIAMPFIIGFAIAYILNIPCVRLQRIFAKSRVKFIAEKRKILSIASVYIIMLAIIVVALRAVVPAIYRSILDIYENFPTYIDNAANYLKELRIDEKLAFININEDVIINKVNEWFSNIDFTKFAQYAQGVLSVTSNVLNIFIAIIASLYMLFDKERIKRTFYRVTGVLMGVGARDKMVGYMKKLNDIFSKYIYSQLIDATIVMVLSIIVLMILKVKYAVLLGVIIGLCNIIPYFGAIFAVGGTILVTCFTGGIGKAIWTGIALIVMQQIDANLIGPRIMGQSLEMRPLLVIIAVTVGSGFFGFMGMILSVPIFAMLKLIAEDLIRARERRLGISINEEEDE